MVLIATMLACVRVDEEAFELISDTSYRGYTRLEQVAATCEDEKIVVRARTTGWIEEALLEVWGPIEKADEDMKTVAFTRDEYCDVFEASVTGPDFSCTAMESGTLTYLVRVQFELGCGGMKAWGAVDESLVYTEGIVPEPGDADCDLDDEDGYNPEDVMGEVVSAVTSCAEPLP